MQDVRGLPLIGRGSFSKVYKKDSKTVIIVSNDPAKEALSMGWLPNSRLIPKLVRVGEGIYEGKLYTRVTAPKKQLRPREYEKYLDLREAFNQRPIGQTPVPDYMYTRGVLETIKNKRLKNILLECVDVLCNWGDDVFFEISPRNIATDSKGGLILLDVFFFKSKLQNKI